MTEPWAFADAPPVIAGEGGVLSLVEGSSFCISAASGDIQPGSPHGLFFRDSRLLSRFELRLNGQPPELLSNALPEPFAGAVVARAAPKAGHADSTLMVF